MVVIEGGIPRGEHKKPMPTLTCGECKHMLVGMHEMLKHHKTLPEDYLKRWDDEAYYKNLKVTEMFTCPNCGHVAEWKEQSKRSNAAITRQRKMERTWGCTGIQRRYR